MLKTKKSNELIHKIFKNIGNTQYSGLYGVCIKSGKNIYLKDIDNNTYIDLMAGASMNNLGYCNTRIANIINKGIITLHGFCFE